MKPLILAIETSGRNHSVAVSSSGTIVAKQDARSFLNNAPNTESSQVSPGPSSSSLLMPMIRSAMKEAAVEPSQIGLISVTNGPGSFTGLRVGVVTAKTLAFALNCPLVSVDTLHACAVRAMNRNQLGEGRVIKTAINAQRGQLFAASFRVATQSEAEKELLDCVPVASAEIVDPKLWVNGLGDADFVTGPGLKMATGLIDDAVAKMPSLQVEQEAFRECDVATVAAIGEQKFLAGETVDAWSLKPVYFRPSAAEEVHSAKSR